MRFNNDSTPSTFPVSPTNDTSAAHPLDHVRNVLDWYEGLFEWGRRWRRAYRDLWRAWGAT